MHGRSRTLPAGLACLACLLAASSGAGAASSGFASTQAAETAVALPNTQFCVNSAHDLALTKPRPLFYFRRASRHTAVSERVSAAAACPGAPAACQLAGSVVVARG